MKRFAVILSLTALTACTSPFGTLQRIFPDGASFEVVDAQLIVTGTGGTLTAKSIRSIGTNGFPLLDSVATNTPAVPKGTVMKVQ